MKHPPRYGPEQFASDLNVSRETMEKLRAYSNALLKWNQKINLVGRSTAEDVWHRHFLDSAQIYPLISPNSQPVLDIGSGAGFPGLVLAILGCSDVHLVESDHKKAAFLREISHLTSTPVRIHAQRVENLKPFPVGTITARAVASLNDLLMLAEPFLFPGTQCLFLKGRNVEVELTEVRNMWDTQITRRPSRTDPESSLVCMHEVRRVKSGQS